MVISIPNYINGELNENGESMVLKDYQGRDFAKIYSVRSLDLRIYKRNVRNIQEKIKTIPITKILNLIKKTYPYYYDEEVIKNSAKLTGTPINFLKESYVYREEFSNNAEELLQMCFNTINYDHVEINDSNNNSLGYRLYTPKGPIVMILPRNSDEESYYLILEALLAKSCCLIKTSTTGCTNYSAIALIIAINKAIDEINDPELFPIKQSIAIVNLFDVHRDQIIKQLEIKDAVYLLFGSDETVNKIKQNLADYKEIIAMGTGLSTSLILDDADIENSILSLCNSSSVNNGLECVGTKIVYVQEKIYNKFMKKIDTISSKFKAGNPLHEESKIGILPDKNIEYIHNKLKEIDKHVHVKRTMNAMHLSYVELDDHEHFEEFPGPIFAIRKIKDEEDFINKLNSDLHKNNLKRNLVTSIYTKNIDRFQKLSSKISSYTVKLNKASSEMNMYLEHQGRYLIKDFLEMRLVET